ncbi:PEP-CTERM sorting domain-containing protein [Kiritimatiellaeota bacterium B1221]|nr:PEP-CTERM sorting domain-containing protein [Kiritimatiellaeota bacterium B1221]
MRHFNRVLLTVFVSGVSAAAFSDVVLYHKYDGDLTDSSAFGNDGTGVNSPTYAIGEYGQAIDLERGGTQYVTVGDNNSLDFGAGAAFTIEGWVKLESFGTSAGNSRQMLAMKKSGSGNADSKMNYGFLVQRGSNGGPSSGEYSQLGLVLGDGNGFTGYYSTLEITDTDWHYVSVRFDDVSNTATFNLDGNSETFNGTVTQAIAANELDLTIGAHMDNTGTIDHSFDGRIDELRISNTFLADGDLLINVIPEPGTMALMVIGFCGFIAFNRRR